MRLYIETSVVSFWYDRHSRNREKRRATRRLFLLCRRGVHEGFTSDLVRAEIGRSLEPDRSRDLRLLTRLGIGDMTFDRGRFDRLFEVYEKHPLLARLPGADLQHLAAFSISDLDGLVTFNLRHVANPVILTCVRKVNHANGIEKELRVASPEAFLPPREV